MSQKERKYGFRERMLQIHQRNIRNESLVPKQDEFELNEGIMIAIGKETDVVTWPGKYIL